MVIYKALPPNQNDDYYVIQNTVTKDYVGLITTTRGADYTPFRAKSIKYETLNECNQAIANLEEIDNYNFNRKQQLAKL